MFSKVSVDDTVLEVSKGIVVDMFTLENVDNEGEVVVSSVDVNGELRFSEVNSIVLNVVDVKSEVVEGTPVDITCVVDSLKSKFVDVFSV